MIYGSDYRRWNRAWGLPLVSPKLATNLRSCGPHALPRASCDSLRESVPLFFFSFFSLALSRRRDDMEDGTTSRSLESDGNAILTRKQGGRQEEEGSSRNIFEKKKRKWRYYIDGRYTLHGAKWEEQNENKREWTRERERGREIVREWERKGSEKERELIKLLTVIKHEKKKLNAAQFSSRVRNSRV